MYVRPAKFFMGVSGGSSFTAYRKGEYFHYALDVGNNVYPTIEVTSNYGTGDTKEGKKFVPPSTEDFQYDDDGNLKSDGRWDYTWDGENRLIEMQRTESTPSGAKQWILFEYDHQGRRIRKTFYTYNGGWVLEKDIIYLYDGWRLMAELDKENNNARIRTYIWGLDLSGSLSGAGGVGGLLKVADYTGTASHHYAAYDGNGNLTALVDASDGSVSARYAYGPFGEPIRASEPDNFDNPMRFSSKYTDAESGLVYYGFRYYNPDMGRWLSRDPLNELGGLNLYTSVNNDQVNSFDPLGLNPFLKFVGKCSWSILKDHLLELLDRYQFKKQASSEVDGEIGAGGVADPFKFCRKWHSFNPNVELEHLEEKTIFDSIGSCIFDFSKSKLLEKALKGLPDGALRDLLKKLGDEAANRTKEEVIALLENSSKEENIKFKCKDKASVTVRLYVSITATIDKVHIPLGEEFITSWPHESRYTRNACCVCSLPN